MATTWQDLMSPQRPANMAMALQGLQHNVESESTADHKQASMHGTGKITMPMNMEGITATAQPKHSHDKSIAVARIMTRHPMIAPPGH
jgi:hypothetical protein